MIASVATSRALKLTLLVAVLLVAGIVRLRPHYDERAQIGPGPQPESMRLARSLAFRGQFANPFRLAETGPSAYLSPGFPTFAALIIRSFGAGANGRYALRFAGTVAAASQLSLLPVVTETLGLGWFCGALACVVGLLAPILTFPEWEVSYAGLLIVLATILWVNFLKDRQRPWLSAALLGVVAGLLLLTSATVFSVLAAWLMYAVWKFRTKVFAQGRWLALALPMAMLTPWAARNYVAFHQFVPFRTALGLALAVSNNDCASASVLETEQTGCYATQSPNFNVEEAQTARSLGEAAYTKTKLQEVVRWTESHPRRFVSLAIQRLAAFWFPFEHDSPIRELAITGRRGERLAIYATTILSLLGLPLLFRFHRSAGFILGSWLLFFPLVYYVALFEDRYRYPILWVTLVCACYPLALVMRKARQIASRHEQGRPPTVIESCEPTGGRT